MKINKHKKQGLLLREDGLLVAHCDDSSWLTESCYWKHCVCVRACVVCVCMRERESLFFLQGHQTPVILTVKYLSHISP